MVYVVLVCLFISYFPLLQVGTEQASFKASLHLAAELCPAALCSRQALLHTAMWEVRVGVLPRDVTTRPPWDCFG